MPSTPSPVADDRLLDRAAHQVLQLTDDQLEDALVQVQQRINSAEAERAIVINELLRRSKSRDTSESHREPQEEFVADHVAVLLSCTKAYANGLLDVAVEASDHPTLLSAWLNGAIDGRKAAVIAKGLRFSDRATCHSTTVQAIEYGHTHTASQLRLWLDRRLLAADPSLAQIRRGRAMSERKLTLTPLADGMAELAAYLPAVQARQIYDTANAVAMSSGSDDARTMDQRRSDAFVDLVNGRAQPPRVNISVVVTAETMMDAECEPGWVSGVGPVTADEAQAIIRTADDCTWRRLIADPDSGYLTDIAERQYRPSLALDRAVRARDLTCRFPGCRRSALGERSGTDLDHTVPWPQGDTSAANLAVLCRHHHRLKHSPGWQVSSEPDGRMTWVTPGGRTIVTTPWEYLDRPPQPPD
ncbi:MAG: DUF222 domain-containing protein [Actinomycetes bacterium]